MFGSLGMPELLLVLALLVWIALLFWVYRDASRRGMNAGLWVVIVIFLHLLGVAVYLIARRMRPSPSP
jgi:membrane-bound metal-dependent hydrolase YbcI (DUF457 family)